MVREMGLEPIRDYHTPLKRARLPIPPLSQTKPFPENDMDYITAGFGCQHLILIFFSDKAA